MVHTKLSHTERMRGRIPGSLPASRAEGVGRTRAGREGLEGQMGGGGPRGKTRSVDLGCIWTGLIWTLTQAQIEIFRVAETTST